MELEKLARDLYVEAEKLSRGVMGKSKGEMFSAILDAAAAKAIAIVAATMLNHAKSSQKKAD